MTAMLQTVERQARQAHAAQLEELTGDDYIHHIERVVALVEGEEAKAVAWLHDVLEDTKVSADDLLAAGVSETVVEAVRVLTKAKPGPDVSPRGETPVVSGLYQDPPRWRERAGDGCEDSGSARSSAPDEPRGADCQHAATI